LRGAERGTAKDHALSLGLSVREKRPKWRGGDPDGHGRQTRRTQSKLGRRFLLIRLAVFA